MATFFSSVSESLKAIRLEAGVTKNNAIGDGKLLDYQSKAYSMIVGYVSSVYNVSDLLDDVYWDNSDAQNILSNCEALITAGMFINAEFGTDGLSDNPGSDKKKEAINTLKEISKGMIKLVGSDGNEFSVSGSSPLYGPTISQTTYEKQFSADQDW